MITEERLKEIEERAKAAESGPWDIELLDDRVEAVGRKATGHGDENAWVLLSDGSPYTLDRADADFIAHARQDVPDLVAEVRRLRDAGRELLEAADAVQGSYERAEVVERLDVAMSEMKKALDG